MNPKRATAWPSIVLLAAGVAAADSDIVDLQPFRSISRIEIESPRGPGSATLVGLNPYVNDWYLLALQIPPSATPFFYHLENPQPATQTLELDGPNGIRIVTRDHSTDCALWDARGADALAQAQRSGLPYAPLCDDRVYLRNPVAGRYTHIERITDFLRDRVWGGDQIVTFARETFFRDAFVERAAPQTATATEAIAPAPNAPRSATIDAEFAQESVDPPHLGIDVGAAPQQLRLGAWYPVPGAAGVFISVIEPRTIDASVLKSFANIVGALDGIEADALDYLVAMDLAQFDVAFALGTDHPRVGWSECVLRYGPRPGAARSRRHRQRRAARRQRDGEPERWSAELSPRSRGASSASTARSAMAHSRNRTTAATTGSSSTARVQQAAAGARHVVRAYRRRRGHDDVDRRGRRRAARAHPLRAPERRADPRRRSADARADVRAALVNRWGAGNWSGSADEKLRTLRAGLCLQETAGDALPDLRLLLERHALRDGARVPGLRLPLRDAPRHECARAHLLGRSTRAARGQLLVQHLIDGMGEVDGKGGDDLAPRFVSFADNRDFFYLMRRATP